MTISNLSSKSKRPFTMYDPELELLGDVTISDGTPEASYNGHTFRSAPIFTGDAFEMGGGDIMPQRAVYGSVISQHATGFPRKVNSPKLFINTNAPFSALVCGVQVRLRVPV